MMYLGVEQRPAGVVFCAAPRDADGCCQ
uniref:Uncharacterized protein n=1 Tax=Anguilla anguilla TaxID=7936 RepID=A0A0E9QLD1_ANGAN